MFFFLYSTFTFTVEPETNLYDAEYSQSKEQEKKKVLFLCYHNSARSQMAEGILRNMYGDSYKAYSAGIKATKVNPLAFMFMKENGIDISGQHPKTSSEYQDTVFDIAVTICYQARQNSPICNTPVGLPDEQPIVTGEPRAREAVHQNFDDPAVATG